MERSEVVPALDSESTVDDAVLDSRILRTLITLCLHPGRLTIEYIEGRRVRYLPPIRLYMVASVLYFFLVAVTVGGTEITMSGMGEGAAPPSAIVSGDSTAADDASMAGAGAAALSNWLVNIAVVAAIVYAFIALLRVYGEGAWRTTIKFCGLALAYTVAFAFVTAASSLIAFGLF